MAKSSNRIRMPDSFRVNQPTLSKKTWMGSLQQRTAEPALPLPATSGGQHCWPSAHWTSPQLRSAWQADTRHADRRVPVVAHAVLPPAGRRGIMSGPPGTRGRVSRASCAVTCRKKKRPMRCVTVRLPFCPAVLSSCAS
uniref:Uncharacterized protein n=1 Tax=Scophthalmus maximus TaxID=52904 RepID=A0A8D3AM56_SCOMX